MLTAFLAFLLQKRPQTGRTSPFLYPVFKRVYSTMYFKICHYEIPIMFLSLRPKLTFFPEYATLSVRNEKIYNRKDRLS